MGGPVEAGRGGRGRGLRPFDRRLLGRVAVARRTLAVCVAAGLGAALLLLVQMTLLAAVIAGAAQGRLGQVPAAVVVALVAIVAARAGLAQAVEVSGRRTATRVMSVLRAELVERRLRPGAGGPGRGNSAELAAGAVQGVDGLETYFARYLPQVVLAVVVPLAVLCWCAAVDRTSALVMAVTLPVVPVFMALIGGAAGARARANFQALAALSSWFLDVVRGLPTLRAFNRGTAQLAGIREVTDRYRRTTMGTLRLSFLSGVVLDLAATLSTALVAVTLGVRLVAGTVGLRPALTVLLLVPELFAPVRALASLFHASADGLAATERILDTLDQAPAAPRPAVDSRQRPPPEGGWPTGGVAVGVCSVTVRYPGRAVAALERVDLELETGELVAVVGGPRGRQDHAGAGGAGAHAAGRGGRGRRGAGAGRGRPRPVAGAGGLGVPASRAGPGDGGREPGPGAARGRAGADRGGGPAGRGRRVRAPAPGRLRHGGRGRRARAVGRAAPAPGAGPGPAARRLPAGP